MGFFSDALSEALFSGNYICPECGAKMVFENENEDTLICTKCGFDEDLDHYGYTDEEYAELYPTKEEVLGYDEDENSNDEDDYEEYREVYNEEYEE